MNENWKPSAGMVNLRRRAEIIRDVRAYFFEAGVLEVDTPILSRAATVEPQIESFRTTSGAWLATSPEFAMKRLLTAGSGPIYQLSRVFRAEESGRLHNPEFLMLEWYRPGFGLGDLIDEVETLIVRLGASADGIARASYRDVVQRHLGVDPFTANAAQLREAIAARGLALPERRSAEEEGDTDYWLDLAMAALVGPQLGLDRPLAVHGYPPSQAALARIRASDPPVAERFELYWRGVELANGYDELTDAEEQASRFAADRAWRAARGRSVPDSDPHLIAALAAGMPASSGVALGMDRLIMLLLGASRLSEVISFDADRI